MTGLCHAFFSDSSTLDQLTPRNAVGVQQTLNLIRHLQEHQRLHGKPLYTSSAQLTVQHTIEELDGRTLLTVANFPRKQIGPRMSDCLITGVQVNSKEEATRKASTVMVQCSHAVPPGMLITVTGNHVTCLSLMHFVTRSSLLANTQDASCHS